MLELLILALRSRSQVFVLKNHSKEDLLKFLNLALMDSAIEKKKPVLKETEALLRISGGDARKLLNALEFVINNVEGDENTDSNITPKMCNEVRESVENCDENGPLVIFIAKMVAVDKSDLNGIDDLILDYDKEENEGGDEGNCTDGINAKEKNRSIFMGFGRIFSGTFDANSKDQMASLYVLGPKYSPFVDGNIDSSSSQQENIQVSQKINEKLFSTQHVHEIKRCRIYPFMMMGKDFRLLKTARAGNVVGVLGLEKYVIKTATISNTLACMVKYYSLH